MDVHVDAHKRADPVTERQVRRGGLFIAFWVAAGVGLLILAVFSLPALSRPPPGSDVTLDRLLDNPAAFYGSEVRVRGKFDGMIDPNAFLLEDDDLVFADEVLVVSNLVLGAIPGWPSDNSLLEPDLPITVTGTVKQFDIAAVEQALEVDLDDAEFTNWAGRPVIVARSVAITPGTANVREASRPADTQP